MAEQKESSVLFSLKELMNLEEDRIREEEAEKERTARIEAERRAREEADRRAAEQARMQAEADARRAEEQRQKEEVARIDAIRTAEIEKAKAEAEHQARLQAMTAQQAHEAQIAALQSDSTKKRLKLIVGIVTAVLVLGGGATVFAVMKSNEEQAQREAILAAEQVRAAQELAKIKADFEAAQKAQEDLQGELASAKDEATKRELEAKLAAAKAETEAKSKAVRSSGGSRPSSGGGSRKPAKDCNCPPGDPLCSCL
jgi:colicin import membrane protein